MRHAGQSPRTRRIVGVLAGLAAAGSLAAVAASADAYYAMPVYGLSPASGSVLPLHPANDRTIVELASEPPPFYDSVSGITVEVSRSLVLGADGTLADDYDVDSEYVYASDGRPGIYRTVLQNFRPLYNSPGRYYFQFSGYTTSLQFVASPIFYYDLTTSGASPSPPSSPSPPAAPDTSMSVSQARSYLVTLVRAHTHHSPRHLHRSCRRTSASSFACAARFTGGRRRYSGTFHFLHANRDGAVVWYGDFSGRSARRSCHSSGCRRRVRWFGV